MKAAIVRRQRVLPLTAATAGAVMFTAIAAAPATAEADKRLLLSSDGQHWVSVLDQPVLPTSIINVPGTSFAGTLWVRNNASEPTSLSVAALTGDGDAELLLHLDLAVMTAGATSGHVSLQDTNGCVEVLDGLPLAPGGALRLDVALAMDIQAPNSTMQKTAEVDMKLLLDPASGNIPAGGAICGDSVGTIVPGLDPTTPETPSPSPSQAAPDFSSAPSPAAVEPHAPSDPAAADMADGSETGNSSDSLAGTGAQGISSLVAAAAGLLILGIALARAARRKGRAK